MSDLILYTTLACHLCEQAKAQIYPALTNKQIALVEIDIADDSQLLERYGTSIPVINFSGSECSWPFTTSDVESLIGQRDV